MLQTQNKKKTVTPYAGDINSSVIPVSLALISCLLSTVSFIKNGKKPKAKMKKNNELQFCGILTVRKGFVFHIFWSVLILNEMVWKYYHSYVLWLKLNTIAPATSGKAFIDAHSSYLWTTEHCIFCCFIFGLFVASVHNTHEGCFFVPILQGITYGWVVFLSLNLCILPTLMNGHSRISVQLAGLHWTFQNLFFWRCICLWLFLVERLRNIQN